MARASIIVYSAIPNRKVPNRNFIMYLLSNGVASFNKLFTRRSFITWDLEPIDCAIFSKVEYILSTVIFSLKRVRWYLFFVISLAASPKSPIFPYISSTSLMVIPVDSAIDLIVNFYAKPNSIHS